MEMGFDNLTPFVRLSFEEAKPLQTYLDGSDKVR
jgi:hypothetical protein